MEKVAELREKLKEGTGNWEIIKELQHDLIRRLVKLMALV